jgi:cephalosporin hydroxylase
MGDRAMVEVPLGDFRPPLVIPDLSSDDRRIIDEFADLYYRKWAHGAGLSTLRVSWLGYEALKCPLDLWIYQEIITQQRPDFIVELGTRFGGSALFMASILDLIDSGMIITIDVDYTVADRRPFHRRIVYVNASTTDAETVREVDNMIPAGARVLVILDSDHSCDHVLKEMQLYAHLVPLGGYMIVEDTNINGHPTYPEYGAGPFEAVQKFIAERQDFAVDNACERFLLTMNPCGYLRRVAQEDLVEAMI